MSKLQKIKGEMCKYVGTKIDITANVFAVLKSDNRLKKDRIVLSDVYSDNGEFLCGKLLITKEVGFDTAKELSKGDKIAIRNVVPFSFDANSRKARKRPYIVYGVDFLFSDLHIIRKKNNTVDRNIKYYKYEFCKGFVSEKSYITPNGLYDIMEHLDDMAEDIESFIKDCVYAYMKNGWCTTKSVVIAECGSLMLKDNTNIGDYELELCRFSYDLHKHPYFLNEYELYNLPDAEKGGFKSEDELIGSWVVLDYNSELKQNIINECIDEIIEPYLGSIDWKYSRIVGELRFRLLLK